MDIYPTILENGKPINAEEKAKDDDPNSDMNEKVADWVAKAYGSQQRKRSFYDPDEKRVKT